MRLKSTCYIVLFLSLSFFFCLGPVKIFVKTGCLKTSVHILLPVCFERLVTFILSRLFLPGTIPSYSSSAQRPFPAAEASLPCRPGEPWSSILLGGMSKALVVERAQQRRQLLALRKPSSCSLPFRAVSSFIVHEAGFTALFHPCSHPG